MTDVSFSKAALPWLLSVAATGTIGLLTGDPMTALLYAQGGAWAGLLASVLWINHLFWGHPLRFTPPSLRES